MTTKTVRTHRVCHTQATSTFAPGGASSAGRMKLKTGVRQLDTMHTVERGVRITTAELCRSVSAAADRFLSGDRPNRKLTA